MHDMSSTIVAKSDQINAADLIGAPRTITVKEVRIKAGEDQPVSIHIEGDNKVFRPCKGVRRLIVRVWGADASNYIGKSMTLFCDPKVTWAGKEEGGIRISHMSGMGEKITEHMRVSRAGTRAYVILPLKQAPANEDNATKFTRAYIASVNNAEDRVALENFANSKSVKLAELEGARPNLHKLCIEALDNRRADFAPEGKPTSETGEGFTDDGMFADEDQPAF